MPGFHPGDTGSSPVLEMLFHHKKYMLSISSIGRATVLLTVGWGFNPLIENMGD